MDVPAMIMRHSGALPSQPEMRGMISVHGSLSDDGRNDWKKMQNSDDYSDTEMWLRVAAIVGVIVVINILCVVCVKCRKKRANTDPRDAQTQGLPMTSVGQQRKNRDSLSSELGMLDDKRDSMYGARPATKGGENGVANGCDPVKHDDDDDLYVEQEQRPTEGGDEAEVGRKQSVYEHGAAGVEVTAGKRADDEDGSMCAQQQLTTKGHAGVTADGAADV